MNRGAVERLRQLIDEARETCTAGLYNKSARLCLLDLSALLVEMRQTVENEFATEETDGARS